MTSGYLGLTKARAAMVAPFKNHSKMRDHGRTSTPRKNTHTGRPQPRRDYRSVRKSLIVEWQELCCRFLPIRSKRSIWRQSRRTPSDYPVQGWKLHISATSLSANQVLKKIGPFLCEQDVLFKAPHSLRELHKINSGIQYGFSQVGKVITIYPENPQQALFLARKLHRLTSKLPAPSVPFDLRFRNKSSVFYRYGGFGDLKIENKDGTRILAIRDPNGQLVPDLRTADAAAATWLADPFAGSNKSQDKTIASPLQTTIRAFQALSQRGKGGVYRAVDVSVDPVRLCVLKEGRRHGETEWDGRDGYWRVRHEGRVLNRLMSAGIPVPEVYMSFTAESHYYLVTEYIEGANLQSLLRKHGKKLPVSEALSYCIQLANLLQKIHSAGWVWRDCKPSNLILTRDGQLRPIDFEGACRIAQPDPVFWGTRRYAAPESRDPSRKSRIPEDLFALGVVLYQLFSGETPGAKTTAATVRTIRGSVPPAVIKLISNLLSRNPERRPGALLAYEIMKAV